MGDIDGGIYGAVSAIVIAGMGILGINRRVSSIDKSKVSKDQFGEYKISIDKQFADVKEHLSGIGKDVKDLLKK